MKKRQPKKAFNVTSLDARLFKGAISEGLRAVRAMVINSVRTPKDYRLQAIWEEITEYAKSINDPQLKQNILNFRDVFFLVVDSDSPYTQHFLNIFRRVLKRTDQITLSTGYAPIAKRLIARKKQLQKQYDTKK